MVQLVPIKYQRWTYPSGIMPHIREVVAHFGKDSVQTDVPFSLHTEYSAGLRTPSALTQKFPAICESYQRGVPVLWTSEQWAAEFAIFVHDLCCGIAPNVIEIHPPYQADSDMLQFFQRFSVFEEHIRQWAPNAQIVIENRSGNLLNRRFLLSTYQSFLKFSEHLDASGSDLRFAFDVPQILTAHKLLQNTTKIVPLLEHMKEVRRNIRSIHLWGCNPKAHWGDFNTTFCGDQSMKRDYLAGLYDLLDDGVQRYFVPEVNSSQADFLSIISDLTETGFTFT